MYSGGFVVSLGAVVWGNPIAHLNAIPIVLGDCRLVPERPLSIAPHDVVPIDRGLLEVSRPGIAGIYRTLAGSRLAGQTMMCVFALSDFCDKLSGAVGRGSNKVKTFSDSDNVDITGQSISAVRDDAPGLPQELLIAGTRDALLSSIV